MATRSFKTHAEKLALVALKIMLFLLAPISYAQLANFDFNNSLVESIAGNDASYLFAGSSGVGEVSDPALASYITDGGNELIYLNGHEGLLLPLEATSAFTGDFVELEFAFKVVAFPDPATQKYLFAIDKEDGSSDVELDISLEKVDETTAYIKIHYNDGVGAGKYIVFTEFTIGEMVNLNFQIDFLNKTWSARTDNAYIQQTFTDEVDVDYWHNGLPQGQIYLGWTRVNPLNYFTNRVGEVAIDHFTIYEAPVSPSQASFETALGLLTGHINGDALLADNAMAANVGIVLAYSGSYLDSKSVVDTYLAAYEAAYPPFYETEEALQGFYDQYDPPSWATMKLQLDIFDNYIQEPYLDLMAGTIFEHHLAFPGPVADTAVRVASADIQVNGTYLSDPAYNCKTDVDYGNHVRRPTGYYAAPGEIVTLTFPEEVVGHDVRVIVGAHTVDVSNKLTVDLRRFPRISKSVVVDNTTVRVLNPFGGAIHIRFPDGSVFGAVDVNISGAVKSPYYSQTLFLQNSYEDFQAEVARADVLWADVESNAFMYTTPLLWASGTTYEWQGKTLEPIPKVLTDMDSMWEAYQMVFGRPYPPARAEYVHVDRTSPWDTLAGGYPMSNTFSKAPVIPLPWLTTSSNQLYIATEDSGTYHPKSTLWHELSHHLCLPTLPNEQETIVQLPFVIAYHLGLGWDFGIPFKYFNNHNIVNRDDATIDWFVSPQFVANENMTKLDLDYQKRGIMKYVDIAFLFGWDKLGEVNKVFYDEWHSLEGGVLARPTEIFVTRDEYILAASNALGINAAPLFHFWGIIPSEELVATLESYESSPEILNRLLEIRELVPDNQAEFQAWFDRLTYTSDKNYNDYVEVLNNYDTANLHDQLVGQIDFIINKYFPVHYFDIEITLGRGGSVSLDGNNPALLGDNLTINFIPDAGFIVKEVLVNGESIGSPESYTFTNIKEPHSVSVAFLRSDTITGQSSTIIFSLLMLVLITRSTKLLKLSKPGNE